MNTFAEQYQGEFIAHIPDSGGNKKSLLCSEIRGAVIAPTLTLPGYYLFLGRKSGERDGRHPIVFLAEGKELLQAGIVKKVKEIARKLFCNTIYIDDADESFFLAIRDSLSGSGTKLYPPLDEDIETGVVRIREWLERRLIDVPKESILGKQMGVVEADKLDESFYAITGLSYLIGGFERENSPDFLGEFQRKSRAEEIEARRAGLDNVSRAALEEFEHISQNLPGGEYFESEEEIFWGLPIS